MGITVLDYRLLPDAQEQIQSLATHARDIPDC